VQVQSAEHVKNHTLERKVTFVVTPAKRNEFGYRIGDTHHRAKLTDHEVDLIRQLRAEGMKVKDLARKFDISKGQASKILRHMQRG
jgi:DNA invertase Pin-like site-specific DNA recombinase